MSYLNTFYSSNYNEHFSNLTNKIDKVTLKIYVYSVPENKENVRRIKEVTKICNEQNLDCEIDYEPKFSPFHFRIIHHRYKNTTLISF